MTATEMIPAVGQAVLVNFDQIDVACIVRDAEMVYGRMRLRIEPLLGTGSRWIETSRISAKLDQNVADSAAKLKIEYLAAIGTGFMPSKQR